MGLMPYVDAVLVFDARETDDTGEYTIRSIAPDENERFMRGKWDAMNEGLEPTGRIPVSDVEFGASAGFRIRTLGIERYATST